MSTKTFCIDITQSDIPAIDWLESASDLPRSSLKQAMHKGAVWLTRNSKTQRLRRVKKMLLPADKLYLYYDEAILNQQPPTPKLVADSKDWSVWFKPKSMFSQGTKWGDHCCLYRFAETSLDRVAYPIHRLDRATSGLMVIAHTKKAAKHLIAQFKNRTVEKLYRATVIGDASHLAEKEHNLIESPIDDKSAITEILQAHFDGKNTHLKIQIFTGRKHQIRRHLASCGFPLIGDRLYGNVNTTQALALEAIALSFICPVSQTPKQFTIK